MEVKPTRSQRWATVVDQVANKIIHLTGSSVAFLTAFAGLGIWVVTGPHFDYSEDGQFVMNTGTRIGTFGMVFSNQTGSPKRAKYKESIAVQLKLNEWIAATQRASNRLMAERKLDG